MYIPSSCSHIHPTYSISLSSYIHTEAITLQSVLMVTSWLLQVADQLPWHHKNPSSLLAAGMRIFASELVHIIDTAWKHAELDLQQQGVTVQTSTQLHDAALASVTFSHLPPIRLSCIRGLVAPSYQGPCLHPDCKLSGFRATGCTSSLRRPCTERHLQQVSCKLNSVYTACLIQKHMS